MTHVNVERVLMALALIAAVFSVVSNFQYGAHAYTWQLVSCVWILTNWLKTEQLNSLNKNK